MIKKQNKDKPNRTKHSQKAKDSSKIFLITALSFVLLFSFMFYACKKPNVVFLDELGAEHVTSGWSESKANKSIDGNPLTVAGQVYKRGLGAHATSQCRIKLDGQAVSFRAVVGIDDEVKKNKGGAERASVEFIVSGLDKNKLKKTLWKSGVMKAGDPAREVNVS
jgi:NPCBM/NEW2 domain.